MFPRLSANTSALRESCVEVLLHSGVVFAFDFLLTLARSWKALNACLWNTPFKNNPIMLKEKMGSGNSTDIHWVCIRSFLWLTNACQDLCSVLLQYSYVSTKILI